MPVYGSGRNTRDWIHVEDHCRAIHAILSSPDVEVETFNIAAENELSVLDITERILARLGKSASLVQHVKDRPGHDRRYALDASKLARKTSFSPSVDFEQGIARTIEWYVANADWWRKVRSGEFRDYYERTYGAR